MEKQQALASVQELVENEKVFLTLCPPSHAYQSEEIIASPCCGKHCELFIKRIDLLMIRKLYVDHFRQLGNTSKENARQMFLATLKRGTSEGMFLVPIVEDWPVCATMVGRALGMSLNMLRNILDEVDVDRPVYRDWYKKSVEKVADSLYLLSKNVQINSLNEVMLPPKFSTRSLSDKPLAISVLRKRMGIAIRQRKGDSLVRCTICTGLAQKMRLAAPGDKKASKLLLSHRKVISEQRSIMNCLYSQSRDDDFDILVLNIDSMSNNHSKLPVLIERPKSITDNDRVPLNLATVQIALPTASSLFSNYDYVTVHGMFKHDSAFNVSLIIDALSKAAFIPSQLVVIADSARNNKSHIFIGALALLLSRVKKMAQIRILYPTTGHTHNSVDAHFGSISTLLKGANANTPDEFCSILRNLNGATSVESAPTIYDFTMIADKMFKPPNLCSNSQIILNKDSSGTVFWSAAKTMCSMELFRSDNNDDKFRCFVREFDPTTFNPRIIKSSPEIARVKLDGLMKVGKGFFTDSQCKSFNESLEKYSKKSFRWQIAQLNESLPKMSINNPTSSFDEEQKTIINYLKQQGFGITNFPKDPAVDDSML